MNTDPTAIAWGMHYDGTAGLHEENTRCFIVMGEFVAFGMTDLGGETNDLIWSVTKCESPEAAQENAVNLTVISEKWGCVLLHPPHVRSLRDSWPHMERWLNRMVKFNNRNDAMDEMYTRTMIQGIPLES